jgi:hypothetical protein
MNLDKLNTMCNWERKKAIYLMNVAENELNLDLDGYGEIGVNQNSGNVYLWIENFNFSLFMPINCELQLSDIYVHYFNFETGEESEKLLTDFDNIKDIYNWIDKIELSK